MAKVLGPEIVVNAVCPGFIEGRWLREGTGHAARPQRNLLKFCDFRVRYMLAVFVLRWFEHVLA